MGVHLAASQSCPEGSVFPRALRLPFDDSKIEFSSVIIAQNIDTLIYTGQTKFNKTEKWPGQITEIKTGASFESEGNGSKELTIIYLTPMDQYAYGQFFFFDSANGYSFVKVHYSTVVSTIDRSDLELKFSESSNTAIQEMGFSYDTDAIVLIYLDKMDSQGELIGQSLVEILVRTKSQLQSNYYEIEVLNSYAINNLPVEAYIQSIFAVHLPTIGQNQGQIMVGMALSTTFLVMPVLPSVSQSYYTGVDTHDTLYNLSMVKQRQSILDQAEYFYFVGKQTVSSNSRIGVWKIKVTQVNDELLYEPIRGTLFQSGTFIQNVDMSWIEVGTSEYLILLSQQTISQKQVTTISVQNDGQQSSRFEEIKSASNSQLPTVASQIECNSPSATCTFLMQSTDGFYQIYLVNIEIITGQASFSINSAVKSLLSPYGTQWMELQGAAFYQNSNASNGFDVFYTVNSINSWFIDEIQQSSSRILTFFVSDRESNCNSELADLFLDVQLRKSILANIYQRQRTSAFQGQSESLYQSEDSSSNTNLGLWVQQQTAIKELDQDLTLYRHDVSQDSSASSFEREFWFSCNQQLNNQQSTFEYIINSIDNVENGDGLVEFHLATAQETSTCPDQITTARAQFYKIDTLGNGSNTQLQISDYIDAGITGADVCNCDEWNSQTDLCNTQQLAIEVQGSLTLIDMDSIGKYVQVSIATTEPKYAGLSLGLELSVYSSQSQISSDMITIEMKEGLIDREVTYEKIGKSECIAKPELEPEPESESEDTDIKENDEEEKIVENQKDDNDSPENEESGEEGEENNPDPPYFQESPSNFYDLAVGDQIESFNLGEIISSLSSDQRFRVELQWLSQTLYSQEVNYESSASVDKAQVSVSYDDFPVQIVENNTKLFVNAKESHFSSQSPLHQSIQESDPYQMMDASGETQSYVTQLISIRVNIIVKSLETKLQTSYFIQIELEQEKVQPSDSGDDRIEDDDSQEGSSSQDGDAEDSSDDDSPAESINQDINDDDDVSKQIAGQPINQDELDKLMEYFFILLNSSNTDFNKVIGQLLQVANFEESVANAQSINGDGESTFDIFEFMKEYARKYGIKKRRESIPPLIYTEELKNYFVLPMLESVDMSGNLLIKFSSEIEPSSFGELVYYFEQEKKPQDKNLKRNLQVDQSSVKAETDEPGEEDSLSYIETILKGFHMMKMELVSSSQNDLDKKAFDWKLEQYDSQYMKLKIIFENPEFISMEATDTLKIIFDKSAYFIRPVSEELLAPPQFFTIIVDMPLQSNSVMSEAQKKVVTDQAKTFVFANFFLSFALQNSLQMMFGSIIALQVLAHLPLANIQMPPNARQCFDIMVTVVSFDYFPISEIFDFGFTPSEPWSEAFTNLRYESLNFIDGMGSIILCIWIGILFIIMAIVLYQFEVSKRSRCCEKWFKKIFEPINVWYASIGFIFGVFFELMVCVSVSYRILESYEYLNRNDKFSIANQMFISLVMIIFIGFIFYFTWVKIPQLNALYLLKRRKQLELYFMKTYNVDREGLKSLQIAQSNKERLTFFMYPVSVRLQKQALYRNRLHENWALEKIKLKKLTKGVEKSHLRIYKPLYSGLSKASRLSLMFTFFQLIRRLSLLYVAMFMQELSFVQVVIFVLLSYISLIYLTVIVPYKSSYENSINILNETITLYVSYHVLVLIGIGNNAEQFTQIGTQIAWTIYFCWLINIAIILVLLLTQLRHSISKCCKKHRKKQVSQQEKKIKAPTRLSDATTQNASNKSSLFITNNTQNNPKLLKPITTIQEISDESDSNDESDNNSSISESNSRQQSNPKIKTENYSEKQPQLVQEHKIGYFQTQYHVSKNLLVDDDLFKTQRESIKASAQLNTQNLQAKLRMNETYDIKLNMEVEICPNDLVVELQKIQNKSDDSSPASKEASISNLQLSDISSAPKIEPKKEFKQQNQSSLVELPSLRMPLTRTLLPQVPAYASFKSEIITQEQPLKKPPPKMTRGLSMVEEWRKEEQQIISGRFDDQSSAAAEAVSEKQLNFGMGISFNNLEEFEISEKQKSLTQMNFGAKNNKLQQKAKASKALKDLVSAVNNLVLDPIDDTEDLHKDE